MKLYTNYQFLWLRTANTRQSSRKVRSHSLFQTHQAEQNDLNMYLSDNGKPAKLRASGFRLQFGVFEQHLSAKDHAVKKPNAAMASGRLSYVGNETENRAMTKLIRLTYASKAQIDASGDESSVVAIVNQSRSNNQLTKIGGALYYADGYFFQCLEGEEYAVLTLVEKIRKDPRHKRLKVSYCKQVRKRYFKAWSMTYIPIGRAVTEFFERRGYDSFQPSEFDESDINELISLFAKLDQDSEKNRMLAASYRLKLHWWQRLGNIFGSQNS